MKKYRVKIETGIYDDLAYSLMKKNNPVHNRTS